MRSRVARLALALGIIATLAGCERPAPPPAAALSGEPAGPYDLQLRLAPTAPLPAQPTRLQFQLLETNSARPVTDLQVVHERRLHTFIVARDFSSFAHLHQEDRVPLSAEDLAAGRFSFDYSFPKAGRYRVQSEFTHRDRSWLKSFDLDVGEPASSLPQVVDLARSQTVGAYTATLSLDPAAPVAGEDVELLLTLNREGQPVTNLQLWLGSEVHAALWRMDLREFAHTHSYTPEMAAMMAQMQGHRMSATETAAMMLAMSAKPAQLVFPGPTVPLRFTFPSAGIWVVFCQLAPGGEPVVFRFMLNVGAAPP
jgi:hypothetical protein